MKNITMQDIANELGVSKTTVSRALNNSGEISDALKEKIKNHAQELGYKVNRQASSLKTKQNKTIGVVANKLINEKGEDFYTRILKNLSIYVSMLNYNLTFEIHEDKTHELLPEILNKTIVDGVIILGEFSNNFFEKYDKLNIPTVIIDYKFDDLRYTSISTNNFVSATNAVNYLISKNHKNIAFVGDKEKTKNVLERYYGYVMALESNNLKTQSIMTKDDSGNFNNLDSNVTAYFCHTDREAYDLILQLRLKGIIVPDDVSVIGFDNTFYSDFSLTKITTMEVDLDLFAKKAVESIINRIKNKSDGNENIALTAKIVEKGSVKKL